MALRTDISDKLIHFTKGESEEAAFNNLRKIIQDGVLIGAGSRIRGRFNCVCFTEAPLDACRQGFVNQNDFSRYSLFGLMFDKKWIYTQGGLPVIYQPEGDYTSLPNAMKWRHMRYEPDLERPIDFTWEREWRIPGQVSFNPSDATIIVSKKYWADLLFNEHENEQDWQFQQYSLILDEDIAMQYRQNFPWRIISFE